MWEIADPATLAIHAVRDVAAMRWLAPGTSCTKRQTDCYADVLVVRQMERECVSGNLLKS